MFHFFLYQHHLDRSLYNIPAETYLCSSEISWICGHWVNVLPYLKNYNNFLALTNNASGFCLPKNAFEISYKNIAPATFQTYTHIY